MSERAKTDRALVFISYARRDKEWLDRLKVHLIPLFRKGNLLFWEDTLLAAGMSWRKELKRHLDGAKVGVLLLSANFLASNFIFKTELPVLRKLKEADKCTLIPVIIEPSILEEMRSRNEPVADETLVWLAEIQCGGGSGSRPLLCAPKPEQEAALARAAFDIYDAARRATIVADMGRKADAADTTEEDQAEHEKKLSILGSLLTECERIQLRKLNKVEDPFPYIWNRSFEQELGRLFVLHFIDRKEEGKGFRTAMRDHGPSNDLRKHFHITKLGQDYLAGTE